MRLRTRVFELADRHDLKDQRSLARFLGLHESTLSKIQSGEREIGGGFQRAVMVAFGPLGYGWNDLFWYERLPEEVPA